MILTVFLSMLSSFFRVILTFAIAIFLSQHAVQGWCPPIPFFQSILGIRTSVEILPEKVTMKILSGDFNQLLPNQVLAGDDGEISAVRLIRIGDLHCEHAQLIKEE
jgi:hypothetical protein